MVPRAFDCVTCGRHVDMDEMVLMPTEGVQEERTEAVDMPWLDRDRAMGPIKRWSKTVGRALVRPGELIRGTPAESSLWRAFQFAFITTALVALVLTSPIALIALAMGRGKLGISGLGFALAWPAAMVILFVGGLFVATAVGHGILRLTGGCAFGIRRTFQVMCYSAGANVLSATPCMGQYFGWIWWSVSAILMLKDGQKVHGGRATLAVLITPVLVIVTVVGGYALFIAWMVRSMPGSGTSFLSTGSGVAVQKVLGVVRTSASASAAGTGEDAQQLLMDGKLSVYDFVDFSDDGDGGVVARLAQSPVGGVMLSKWDTVPARVSQGAAKLAISRLSPETVAYRVGDMVFLHHGIDIQNPGPGAEKLWIMVSWRETRPKSDPGPCHVGLASGSNTTIIGGTFDSELDRQNLLRAKLGLGLIPHPADVKSDQPVQRNDAKYAPAAGSTSKP